MVRFAPGARDGFVRDTEKNVPPVFGWIIVCGGRQYFDYNRLSRVLWDLEAERGLLFVRHGAATGADAMADRWCHETGHTVVPVFAQWNRHGNKAGPIRNAEMLAMKPPVKLVVAFPGGTGTADMVAKAKAAGVEVLEVPA